MLVLHNQRIELSNVRKKNTKCGKSTVKCDIGTVQLLNVRKKIRESANVTKELLHMMLELHSVRIKPSNVMFW